MVLRETFRPRKNDTSALFCDLKITLKIKKSNNVYNDYSNSNWIVWINYFKSATAVTKFWDFFYLSIIKKNISSI